MAASYCVNVPGLEHPRLKINTRRYLIDLGALRAIEVVGSEISNKNTIFIDRPHSH